MEKVKMNHLRAFMYLQEAEQMPEDASDEWFLRPEPAIELVDRCQDILRGLNYILETISEEQSQEEIQAIFYEAGKRYYGTEKSELRMFFRGLYQLLFRTTSGPRWGQFVKATSVKDFQTFVQKRLEDPLGI